jgi:hypothetical protein
MPSEFSKTSSSEVLLSESRLREAIAMLGERGVTQARRAALDAAAVVIERCCEEFDRRGDKNPGWLFRAVSDGSVWFRDAASGARRLSASELLVWIDEAEQQREELAA